MLHIISTGSRVNQFWSRLTCSHNLGGCRLFMLGDKNVKFNGIAFWFLVLGVDAFHRKESGYPQRDFASLPDRAYYWKSRLASLIQDLLLEIKICLGQHCQSQKNLQFWPMLSKDFYNSTPFYLFLMFIFMFPEYMFK